MNRLLGNLLRIENVEDIAGWRVGFAATWAAEHPWRVLAACLLAAAGASWFYRRRQPDLPPTIRRALTALRAGSLALLAVLLADPILEVAVRHAPRPVLWMLFDGSESMAIPDDLPSADRETLALATGLVAEGSAEPPTRQDYVAAWLRKSAGNVTATLAEQFRLRGFLLESPESVRTLAIDPAAGPAEVGKALAEQLTTAGKVTALGGGFEELAMRQSSGNLQGVVVVSDFDQNAGPPAAEAARRLGVPVYTLGVGPAASEDLTLELMAPPMMKKGERSTITAAVRQTGLDGQTVRVVATVRPLDGPAAGEAAVIGERDLTLAGPAASLEFPFTPEAAGRVEFAVAADPLAGEAAATNNRAVRDVTVRDDFLRLMYVEYEPTWEWRFVKEVFHRDSLVGMRGFRTFLRSADPRVRAANELFVTTPAPPRSDFFATDVIFLGDMPASALSSRFCSLTREFVERFGGGLVVIAGHRFGPAQLAGTPLEDMLPVVLAGDGPPQQEAFTLRLTPDADLVDFMQLGDDEAENRRAWANLGPLPWYQPVARPHPQATVLAEHPTDTCADGRTPQPLIAMRRFGRGEVVYLGFNETWRLRKRYGERYYRQLWGQMIHRLALGHALGNQKRFVVRTDSDRYDSDDTALVTVEAYDANFEPLETDDLPEGVLVARLQRPAAAGRDSEPQQVALPMVRNGVFEARLPLAEEGDYRLSVQDPLTRTESDASFTVTTVSAERRGVVRNAALQTSLAVETGDFACDLASADRLAAEIRPVLRSERSVKVLPLGMTWVCLLAGLVLMIGEWILRRHANLS